MLVTKCAGYKFEVFARWFGRWVLLAKKFSDMIFLSFCCVTQTMWKRWDLIKVNCKVRRPYPNHKSEHDFRICWIPFTVKTLLSLKSGYASAIWPYLSKSFPFSRFFFIKMTILGKIDNGEHLNIDRGPYFDHDERDQLLRNFTILDKIYSITFMAVFVCPCVTY